MNNLKVLINEEKLQNRIKELAKEIEKDYINSDKLIFICILKGSIYFTTDLSKNINKDIRLEFIKVSSYSKTESTGKISFDLGLNCNIENQDVLIIEDIIDSGRTLRWLSDYLNAKKPKSLKICTLLDKPDKRIFDLTSDYTGFTIPDKFVIGYGLDYDEKYRNLPFISYIDD